MKIRKALFLVTIMLLLSGMAPGYRVNERNSYKPSSRHIYFIQLRLYIKRTGIMKPYGRGILKHEYHSSGYIDFDFWDPPSRFTIKEKGKGRGWLTFLLCAEGHCGTVYTVHPVVYEVVEVKQLHDGRRIKIRETWKPSTHKFTVRGSVINYDLGAPAEGFVMGTYAVYFPFSQGFRTSHSSRDGWIRWKEYFKVSNLRVRIMGNTGDK